KLNAPEIIFLLGVTIAVMIRMMIERNGHRSLPDTPRYLSRMPVMSTRRSRGGSPRQRDGSRSRWEFLHGWMAAIAIVSMAMGNVVDQFEQMPILNLLDAIGENYKPAIKVIEFA